MRSSLFISDSQPRTSSLRFTFVDQLILFSDLELFVPMPFTNSEQWRSFFYQRFPAEHRMRCLRRNLGPPYSGTKTIMILVFLMFCMPSRHVVGFQSPCRLGSCLFINLASNFEQTCMRCRSETKFDSGCGWPAFYAEIPGTVDRHVDVSFWKFTTIWICATARVEIPKIWPR